MYDDLNLSRSEQKHVDASTQRRKDMEASQIPLLKSVVDAVNACGGYSDTAPITIYGLTTREYCIVPCSDQDPVVLRVIQYMQGHNYYCQRFRTLDSMQDPSKYTHVLLVSWDPRILRKSVAPKYYSTEEGITIPCGDCRKQRNVTSGDTPSEDSVAACQGCDMLRLWLPGVYVLEGYGDPCNKCGRATKKGLPPCTDCPTRAMWKRLYGGKDGETGKGPSNETKWRAREAKVPLATLRPSNIVASSNNPRKKKFHKKNRPNGGSVPASGVQPVNGDAAIEAEVTPSILGDKPLVPSPVTDVSELEQRAIADSLTLPEDIGLPSAEEMDSRAEDEAQAQETETPVQEAASGTVGGGIDYGSLPKGYHIISGADGVRIVAPGEQ